MRRAKRTGRRRRILLRPCRARDVEQVLELWRRAAAEPSVTDAADALRQRLERDRDLFLLAWDRGRLVGTLIGGWDGWRGHLYRLAVEPGIAVAASRDDWWRTSRPVYERWGRCGSTESS